MKPKRLPKRPMKPTPRLSRTRLAAALVGAALAWGSSGNVVGAAEPVLQAPASSAAASTQRAFLDEYCVRCHNERLRTAGLVLEGLDLAQVSPAAEVWEKVILKVRGGEMPPLTAPQPPAAAADALVSYLGTSIDRAAATSPNPGRPLIHRLNRVEYANAVRDLLGVEIDASAQLPADDSSYGFDNVADVLSMSASLLERYLIVAKKVGRIATGDPTLRPAAETYRVPLARVQDDRMSEALPFGSRGGLAVSHTFPTDAEYELKLKLQRNSINTSWAIRGLDTDNQIDVYLDGAHVTQFAIPASQEERGFDYQDRGDIEAPLHLRLPVKAGRRTIGVTFPRQHWYMEGVGMSRMPPASNAFEEGRVSSQTYGKIEMGIDTVEITGPFAATVPEDSPSRQRLFVCRPVGAADEEPCARTILSTLARRAYRRPVEPVDIEPLLAFYREGRAEGGFDDGIQAGLIRVLMSPYFLLRKEEDPPNAAPGTIHRISDIELASRLSFFLWSSLPDDELLDLAASSRLSDSTVLEQQVRRMLRDPRAQQLVANFFGQWLQLRNVTTHRPDNRLFPEFDENLRAAFHRETELFLQSQLQEDRPVTDLLTADYTFLNEQLARHYGVPGVYGSHFRRVTLPDDRRAGLLGQGAVLMVTSYPDRTSPVIRGKWLLENILGAPPPPPPADVPPFPENTEGAQPKSVRERMELHRRNPVCAQCHAKIDPLGFALEHFDAVGKYRTTDAGSPIDASGTMPDGTTFDGPATFKQALLAQRERVVATLTQRLLTYGLGRGVEYTDMPAVRAIVREVAEGGTRWSSLILSIVRSTPFQMRRTPS